MANITLASVSIMFFSNFGIEMIFQDFKRDIETYNRSVTAGATFAGLFFHKFHSSRALKRTP